MLAKAAAVGIGRADFHRSSTSGKSRSEKVPQPTLPGFDCPGILSQFARATIIA